MIYDPYPFKRCCQCGNEYLPTKTFFNWSKERGVRQPCRICVRAKGRKDQMLHATKRREASRRYVMRHREELAARTREYREKYPEKVKASQKKYEQNHPDKIRAKHMRKNRKEKQERLTNPERLRISERERYMANPADKIAANRRRRARKRNLPTGFSAEDWQLCLDYWHNCCAYCGQQQGLFKSMKITIDHWIPIAAGEVDNPGDTPENILPACLSCNSSKKHSDPIEWLNRQYGKRKAAKFLKRIEAYFEWIRKRE